MDELMSSECDESSSGRSKMLCNYFARVNLYEISARHEGSESPYHSMDGKVLGIESPFPLGARPRVNVLDGGDNAFKLTIVAQVTLPPPPPIHTTKVSMGIDQQLLTTGAKESFDNIPFSHFAQEPESTVNDVYLHYEVF
ncbi:hypothetical protein TanjilG_00233 [Lupinus angustifolius]|uniref:Uncharacterized protein n=1 Tax=Lupinus angustifolius TaxID=3871 RepID=A0A394D3W3_LUPAN|nr:hypothetical protein TanjilG_00233 [Lupinus angustifolius]